MHPPKKIFDREREWADLAGFVQAAVPRFRLGVLYGRRRFGKSFLLRSLVRQAGGLYHLAIEEERQPALTRFASRVAALQTPSPPLAFDDWDAGLRYLFDLLGGQPQQSVVVLDEYPYLSATSPDLDSVLQAIVDDVANEEFGTNWQGAVSVVLCGSAMSVMTDILSGSSPLRGRASLDTVLGPFDYRQFREYWGINDLATAFHMHAVIGGAPGYKDLTAATHLPQSIDDIPRWLGETVLNPSHSLFREDAYLLREDPRVTKQSLYYSILNAVAAGASARSKIASAIGKRASDLDYPLNVLLSAGFLRKDDDFLSLRSPTYLVADPIIRFHEVITRGNEAMAEERNVDALWRTAAGAFHSQVVGPHFEDVARIWTAKYADVGELGGPIGEPRALQVNARTAAQRFQLDVVAATQASASRRKKVIQVLGEAKGTHTPMTVAALTRLEQLRGELAGRGVQFSRTARYLLFSLAGFNSDLLRIAAGRSDIELIDLPRLYGSQ